MVAYKESPTVSAVLDFRFDRLVGDKHHTAEIKIAVTPTHREGDHESKPKWAISTHDNENDPVILCYFLCLLFRNCPNRYFGL